MAEEEIVKGKESIEKPVPVKKFRAGAVSATVWKNDKKNKQGDKFTEYAVSLERNYTDKEGKWNTTSSMKTNDLPKAELVSRQAYEFLVTKLGKEEASASSLL